MHYQKEKVWVDVTDLNQGMEASSTSEAEFNPIAFDTVLEDDKIGLVEASRRDFLKVLGFGISAATLASCEIPVKKAIPYVIKPDEIVPGVANYYASTIVTGGDFCPVLVKTREGRPIKIEGNALSSITRGGTSARAQASVLSLYDYNRIKTPSRVTGEGKLQEVTWDELDKAITSEINPASRIRLITSTVLSPTAKMVIAEFCAQYPNTKWVCYDPISSAALLRAGQLCFGERVLPDYRFDKAKVIVSFNADFLGTWISPIEYAAQYVKGRVVNTEKPEMSRHIQLESHMSLTGSNADNRILVKPSQQGAAIAWLYNKIAAAVGSGSVDAPSVDEKLKNALNKIAEELLAAKGKSLVVCGNNHVGEQVLVYAINQMLGNVGQTVNFAQASYQRQGSDADFIQCVQDMNNNAVDAVIVWGANPCYDNPLASEFIAGLKNVKTKITCNTTPDETSVYCDYLAPDHHNLESWGDAEAKRGSYSLIQPTINPIFNTRQACLSLLIWAGSTNINPDSEQPYYDYLRKVWKEKIFSKTTGKDFTSFWDKALHDGVFEYTPAASNAPPFKGNTAEAAKQIAKPSDSPIEINFTESIAIGAGQYATNPWLMELPDPVSRTVWGNYLAVPIHFDGDRRFYADYNVKNDGEELTLNLAGNELTVAAIKQFGQMPGTVAIALGYGRTRAGDCGSGVGVNLFPYLKIDNGYFQYYSADVTIANATGKQEKHFACVQHHHTLGVTAADKSSGEKFNADEAALVDEAFKGFTKGYQGSLTKRSIVRQTNIKNLESSVAELAKERKAHQALNSHTLYPSYEYKYNAGHKWGMHIDLNACIGCGSCAVACMAENNVPVVGKKEVSRHHEMSWIRIDRYYFGDVANPNVFYQPLMCQHCQNAPCENVCPVNATNHSSEGLNQMAYNRCVGTRYCANNCPYKVRRFNWFDFTTADLFPVNQKNIHLESEKPFYADNLTRMVLNPDVTVRSRGVIEKCSFCVQRIQEGKLRAKKENRPVTDSDVKTACQTACPTGAITFGDVNNENGILHAKLKNPLNYLVLEEVNVQSSVNYTMKVVNRDESLDA